MPGGHLGAVGAVAPAAVVLQPPAVAGKRGELEGERAAVGQVNAAWPTRRRRASIASVSAGRRVGCGQISTWRSARVAPSIARHSGPRSAANERRLRGSADCRASSRASSRAADAVSAPTREGSDAHPRSRAPAALAPASVVPTSPPAPRPASGERCGARASPKSRGWPRRRRRLAARRAAVRWAERLEGATSARRRRGDFEAAEEHELSQERADSKVLNRAAAADASRCCRSARRQRSSHGRHRLRRRARRAINRRARSRRLQRTPPASAAASGVVTRRRRRRRGAVPRGARTPTAQHGSAPASDCGAPPTALRPRSSVRSVRADAREAARATAARRRRRGRSRRARGGAALRGRGDSARAAASVNELTPSERRTSLGGPCVPARRRARRQTGVGQLFDPSTAKRGP